MKDLQLNPTKIEEESMAIIDSILLEEYKTKLSGKPAPIIKRCIHTSADFSYAENLYFSKNSIENISEALKAQALIVTDTNMALAGINKAALKKLGVEALCYMADEEVAKEAKERGITRAIIAVEKASRQNKPVIFVVGNAPTALIKLHQLITEENYKPAGIIAVPVGFVNVVESKEMIMETKADVIVAKGRKGGSNIAAAIVNALMYEITGR
ncbi:MAG: precorrin-8X methylmutase [Filifactoraceae bacterium]